MSSKTHSLITGIAFLMIGLSVVSAVTLTASRIVRADPGVLYAAPAAQGSGDCSSWDTACTLQTALAQAVSSDEIWVQAGVHYPGILITDTFTLQNGVALYGGFAGTESNRDERDWTVNVTVLSGDIDQNDITDPNGVVTDTANIQGENAYHVVTSSGTDSTAILDGFYITAGQADGNFFPGANGGGMYNYQSSPTLNNVTLSGNLARSGGGMENIESSPTLTNVSFSGNSANRGGGISNMHDSNPRLTNVTFSGNTAVHGGGMYNYESSPTLTTVTFTANTATQYGGGMYNWLRNHPTLTDVTFSNNSASHGGGIYNDGSSPTLTEVTFSANTGTQYGGGMYNLESSPTLTDATFIANSSLYGGGMYNINNSSPTLTGVTFSTNTAAHAGGGMSNWYGSHPTLTNVTFSGNTNGMVNAYSSHPTLTDVIFSENSSENGAGMLNRDSSSPTLIRVTFSGNTGTSYGGGMANFGNSNPSLIDVTFSGNSASVDGGGMYNSGSTPTLGNVTFDGNSATNGGGMYNGSSGSPTLTHVVFISNTVTLYGGGMYNYASSPTLTNVTFSSNTAFHGGGMYNLQESSPILSNITFSSNLADMEGGGMYNMDESSPTLTNVTFSGNTAQYGGGGVSTYNSSPTLTNVTFSSNVSPMQNYNSGITLTNVIVWGNINPIYNDSSTPHISYSDIQGCGGSGSWNSACGADGGGNIEADPLFVDAANGDLRLQLTSPAIDAGNNAALPPDILTDLDGNPRFVDIPIVPDTGSGTPPIVDMGAYEAQFVDVALGKAVLPPAAVPGEAITFTLTLTNAGSIPATGIVVTDTLPAWLWGVFFTSTLTVTDTGHVPPFVWLVQDLAPGQAGLITVSGELTVPLAAGTYTNTAFISAADDLLAENNTAVITFTVPNVAPVFTSAPVITATEGAPYTYTAAAQDDNGDTLTITASTLPAWLTLTDHGNGTATLSGTPTNADVGEHSVVLRVTDGGGLTDTQTFTITVWGRIYLPLVLRNTP